MYRRKQVNIVSGFANVLIIVVPWIVLSGINPVAAILYPIVITIFILKH